MIITKNADGTFALSDVSRPQLTRIALAIGAIPPSELVKEAKEYVKVTNEVADVTEGWGEEYSEMLVALGIDLKACVEIVGDRREAESYGK